MFKYGDKHKDDSKNVHGKVMRNHLLRLRLGEIYHWGVFSVSRTDNLSFLAHFRTTEQKIAWDPLLIF